MEEVMPEPVTPAAPAAPAVVQPTTPQGAKPDETLGEGGQKALQVERAARKAAEDSAKSLQAQLDSIKQAQMSDLEKAQAQATEYQTAAAKATAEALRWRIAAKHGISDEDASTFLNGADEATLTKQAERLAALNKTSPAGPRPDLTQGGKSTAGTSSPEQDFEAFLKNAMAR